MTIQELIKEYRDQVAICSAVDYADKNSVKANNDAVSRMYKIVDTIVSDFGVDGAREFSLLLDVTENETNIWAATHLLEKMKADPAAEKKALAIIKNVAEQNDARGLGYRHWLENWKKKTDPSASL
jgi:hypothetical protein